MQPSAKDLRWFAERESKPIEENIDRERSRAWYANPTRKADCPNCGHSILSEVRLWFNYGFNDGARWSLRYSSKLSPHIAKFIELLTWSMLEDDSLVKTLKRVVLGEIVP